MHCNFLRISRILVIINIINHAHDEKGFLSVNNKKAMETTRKIKQFNCLYSLNVVNSMQERKKEIIKEEHEQKMQ